VTEQRDFALSKLQAELLDREALLEYVALPTREVAVFLVTRDGCHAAKLAATSSDLARYTGIVRDGLSRGGASPGDEAVLNARLAALRTVILGPIESRLERIERLVVVPGGVLDGIPFQALPRIHEGTVEDFLIDRMTIAYAPCAGAFLACKSRKDVGRLKALCVGDPKGSGRLHWPELRSARAEARVLGHVFPEATVLLGDEATESRVLELAPEHTILHFACHGVALKDPLESFLVLKSDQRNDGFLTVGEILPLRLNCNLVTLSACETGVASVAARTDAAAVSVSLAGAFLQAGAHAAVASFWEVESDSTALLMLELYRRVGEVGPAAALRDAERSLRARPEFSHPYFWAAFSCFGDSR
jgi:CHAT domain-containing protein